MEYRLEIVTHDDPYPLYAYLRDEDPAHYSAAEDLWVLSRHEDCLQAFGDPLLWSSERRGNLINDLEDRRGKTLGTTDPPRHTANRRTISGAFTPQTVARLEPRSRQLAETYVGDAIERGRVELVGEALTPFIAATLGEMFGVPRSDFTMLRGWLARLFVRDRPVNGAEPPQVVASRQLRAYLATLAADQDDRGQENLLTALLHTEVDGRRFDIDQVVATTMTFLAAGSESVSNLITNSLSALELHPPVRDRLRADPGGVPGALEEVLRWDSPTQGFVRSPTRGVRVYDREIPEGAQVLLHIGAANRDPRAFDQPDLFDVDRPPRRHLSFGHGPHHCIGAALGRQMARLIVETVLTHAASWEIDRGAATRVTTPNHRGYATLPMTLRAA